MRTKGVILLLAGIAALTVSGGNLYASCGALPIQHGNSGTTSFVNCGDAPVAFAWTHGRGVQGTLAALTVNTGTAAGHDSGANQTAAQAMMQPGAVSGQWFGTTDFSNPGWNGCAFVVTDPTNPSNCTSAVNPTALDYAITGVEAGAPNVAKMAVLSVDLNPFYGYYLLDQAGADPTPGGEPCFEDAFQNRVGDVSCQPIPAPTLVGVNNCSATGCNVLVNIGDVGPLVNESMLDDCNVAEDRADNCPRNLYQGRVLLFKHGACTASTGASFDRKTWVYPALPSTGTLDVTGNYTVFSAEDANLNGVLDTGEDTNANAALDPILIPGTGPVPNFSVRVPAVVGASDCIFLAMGVRVDAGGGCINPPTCSFFGKPVISPVVSLDTSPIRSGSGTPVSDAVSTISASKSQGKGTVTWSTGIELATSGFNVIGTKKNGTETKLNGSLIEAKEGTTGRGASYTATFDAAQLKGSASVYVEIVKTDGSKERFGPASF